eukprot:6274745-Prymnesium_polylepis.1
MPHQQTRHARVALASRPAQAPARRPAGRLHREPLRLRPPRLPRGRVPASCAPHRRSAAIWHNR